VETCSSARGSDHEDAAGIVCGEELNDVADIEGKLQIGLREVVMDRQTMLLIRSAIVAVLIIASVMLGAGGLLMSR
jgi:hypothetical protein